MNLALSAIDTWFFRDGTPFDKGGSSQDGVVGVFPPYPPTVTGAIRAALARAQGWRGPERWGSRLAAVLGDGPDDLGRLRITGPFVLRDCAPVFPMPRHVVGRVDRSRPWRPAALMRPGPRQQASDLGGQVRLPEIDRATGDLPLEAASEHWITIAGLRQILRGDLPGAEHLVRQRELWAVEHRVGIERAPSTHVVNEGALYSTRHVRPHPSVSLGVDVDGVPSDWSWPTGAIPLGGESRVAACAARDAALRLDTPTEASSTAVLIVLTPLLLTDDEVRGQAALRRAGARIVTACMERPLRIGGWDSMNRTPLPLRNAVPPGSALFCEVDAPGPLHETMTNGLVRVGTATAAGFGLCAIASAPRWERTT